MLEASNVKRYHTFSIIGGQNIGHHSHRVAIILWFLTDGMASGNLIKAALFHDLSEIETGDTPATAKWSYPSIATSLKTVESMFDTHYQIDVELTAREQFLLKVADILELMIFAVEQRRLGNLNAKRLWARGYNYLNKLRKDQEPVENLERMLARLHGDIA